VISSKGLLAQQPRGRSPRAQQSAKPRRVGILWPNPLAASTHFVEAFKQGLRELGYADGQNVTIEFRSAEGRDDRLAELATELVHLPVDVIQTGNSPGIRAAQQATRTIPIVMGNRSGPCERRLRSEPIGELLHFAELPGEGRPWPPSGFRPHRAQIKSKIKSKCDLSHRQPHMTSARCTHSR
jgi:ABC transporter substrate binding protein